MDNLALDSEGFLCCTSDWSELVARALAEKENIVLTDDHWVWILLVRRFYDQYELSPNMRVLIRYAKADLGPEIARSLVLMKLFGESPVKVLAKIAGLPKPPNCL